MSFFKAILTVITGKALVLSYNKESKKVIAYNGNTLSNRDAYILSSNTAECLKKHI